MAGGGLELTTGEVVDRYQVLGRLGSGGAAVVYRVRHLQLGTEHALKLIQRASPAAMRRLLDEGRAQARLEHPNIVSVTDVIEVDLSPALIMEYVRGPTLADLLVRDRLSLDQADVLARQLLAAMSCAHDSGPRPSRSPRVRLNLEKKCHYRQFPPSGRSGAMWPECS